MKLAGTLDKTNVAKDKLTNVAKDKLTNVAKDKLSFVCS